MTPRESWDKGLGFELFQRLLAALPPDRLARRDLSLSEIAGVLGKPSAVVESLVEAGTLSAERTAEGALLFSINDLLAFAGRGLGPRTRAQRQLERRREAALRFFAGLPPELRRRPRYSVTTMARHLQVSRATIKALAQAGLLPGHRMPSGPWKFPIDSMLLGLGGPRLRRIRADQPPDGEAGAP